MKRGGAILWALVLLSAPLPAAAGQESAAAENEVQRLRQAQKLLNEQLRSAEARAVAARELDAAKAEAAAANGRMQSAVARMAALQSAPPPNSAPVAPEVAGPDLSTSSAEKIAEEIVDEQEARATQKFGGIEFGVGVSFTLDVGSNDRITDAMLVDDVVRLTDVDNGRARIMLESHYFFKPRRCLFGLSYGMCGVGPFIALQPGTDEIIEAVALGAMIGLRKSEAGTESFNLGLGIVIDPNTRVLGDGIVANQPLPGGETEIRFKEEMQTGILLLASFGF